jgi:glycosyltransferase involved in cell wall biosynthesis
MKIALILPGSGSQRYCENCARDGSLAAGLKARGHEVIVCPLYLPPPYVRFDTGQPPIFYGAVNLYLKQRLPFLRRTPKWISRLLDSRPALKLAGSMSGSTDSSGLEELTISMLRGEVGNQRAELEELVAWLSELRPDIVHLSNALLLGLAGRVRESLQVPIVCSLQDEDGWIEAMRPPYADMAWELMSRRAREVDLFLPVSNWYGVKMGELLGVHQSRMRTVHIGLEIDPLPLRRPPDPPVVGFLAPMTREMGLGLLADAFLLLRQRARHSRTRLAISGGTAGRSGRFATRVVRTLRAAGAAADVELQAGYNSVKSKYTLSRMIYTIENIYHDLLGEGS